MYFVYHNFNKTRGIYERKNVRGNNFFDVNCNWKGKL